MFQVGDRIQHASLRSPVIVASVNTCCDCGREVVGFKNPRTGQMAFELASECAAA